MKATQKPNGFALATSAAALFAAALSGCATQAANERADSQTRTTPVPHSSQDQYRGPARPCSVNICGGQRDCV